MGNGNGILNKDDIINHILINGQIGGDELQKEDDQKDYDGLVDDLLTEILQNEEQNDNIAFIEDFDHVYTDSGDENDIKCDEIHENVNDFDHIPYTQMVKKISASRFSHIMEHTEKEYDIEALVHSLAPTPSGHIRLSSINTFDGVIRSRQSICKMMDDMVDTIAKEYFNDECMDNYIEID